MRLSPFSAISIALAVASLAAAYSTDSGASYNSRDYVDELSTREVLSQLSTRELMHELSDRLEHRAPKGNNDPKTGTVCAYCNLPWGKIQGTACYARPNAIPGPHVQKT
ncbi:hypothetical protein D9611_013403 [Ephemerocybe angulata]|uniref:Uncharacterized protein n=1 Tax=Ephemerocybe angulata TaxID=980116 RepID=A0A8H5BV93_9AGAR|nr:hypothetical protein D9611_013403 [Tulosesus angulatus]